MFIYVYFTHNDLLLVFVMLVPLRDMNMPFFDTFTFMFYNFIRLMVLKIVVTLNFSMFVCMIYTSPIIVSVVYLMFHISLTYTIHHVVDPLGQNLSFRTLRIAKVSIL